MTFINTFKSEMDNVGAGEIIGKGHIIDSYNEFGIEIRAGVFARSDGDKLRRLDGTELPKVAGIVRRKVGKSIESNQVYDSAIDSLVNVAEFGLVSVDAVIGLDPAKNDPIYAENSTEINYGKATTSDSLGVPTGAVFKYKLNDSTWVVLMGVVK